MKHRAHRLNLFTTNQPVEKVILLEYIITLKHDFVDTLRLYVAP